MSEYAHTHLRASEDLQELAGSPTRDLFKLLHKRKLPRHMFGCDVDFVLVEKNPDCIVAFLDVKLMGDLVTFTEVIAYNALLAVAPLFLVYAQDEAALERGAFTIHSYLGGNRGPNPPTIRQKLAVRTENWQDFGDWEQSLRNHTKRA